MYHFIGRRSVFSGFGMDVPYTDSYKRTGTASVLPKAPDCGSGKGVQQILNDLGYAAGTVDGTFGTNTFSALARFAADNGAAYQPSTYPTANLCSLLMQAWQQHQAAASSVSPPGAGIVAAASTPSADVPVPVTQYTASPAGTVGPGSEQMEQPPSIQSGSAASVGIVQKAKDWWAGATSTKKAMVVGGLGLAVVILAAMSLKAPVGRPMTANRRRRFKRNTCGCRAPVSVGTMAANGHSGIAAARRRMDRMSDAELRRFAGRLHQAYLAGAGKGDAYRLWLKAIDMLHGRKAMHPNASSGRYIHVSWLPQKHAARHSTIVHRSNVAQLKRQLAADGATRVRVARTAQRPDTHFTRNAKKRSSWVRVTGTYRDGDRVSYTMPVRDAPLFMTGLRERGVRNICVEPSAKGPTRFSRNARRCSYCGGAGYIKRPGGEFERWCRCAKGKRLSAEAGDRDDRKMGRGRYARNPGAPGHMHRISWKYWTGQPGSTEIPENMLKELVHRLRKVGATDIRVSGDFGRSLAEGAYRANRKRSRAKKCSPLKSRVGTCRCTPAAKYRRLGARHASDYAFEQCFMYPIRFHGKGGKIKVELTKKHIRTAAARFAKWKRRYPKTTRTRIGRRIEAAKKRYGIGKR